MSRRRLFDHEEAVRLRSEDPATWTWQALADRYGVTVQAILYAVRRVTDPDWKARQNTYSREYQRENLRAPCEGGCGALVWTHVLGRSGFCPACKGAQRAAPNVRDAELRCTRCGEWKPDSEFGAEKRPSRRARRSWCRVCEAAVRRKNRQANPDRERAKNNARKRKDQPMMNFTVLYRNGNGWKTHAEGIEAATALHAIEKAADQAGEYVALSDRQIQRVEPVTQMRVVGKAA